MREILFRGKRVSGCGWLVSRTLWNIKGNIFLRDATGKWINVISETVGQFTGVFYKDGTRMFEGDLISTDLDRPFNIVDFERGQFILRCHCDGEDYTDSIFSPNEEGNVYKWGECIGNIHDNPELLEWEEPEEEGE